MKIRIFKSITAVILLFSLLCVSLSACSKGDPPELDGVRERYVYLIEESRRLNTVFFGIGLPVYRRGDALSERRMVYYNDAIGGYNRATEESGFGSIDEIREATASVYSEEYRNALYETAFDGVVTGNSGAYLRFYETEGILYQNISAPDFGLNERIYDYSTMTIDAASTASYVHVAIESYSIGDPARIVVYLNFVFENGDWFLDSPTY